VIAIVAFLIYAYMQFSEEKAKRQEPRIEHFLFNSRLKSQTQGGSRTLFDQGRSPRAWHYKRYGRRTISPLNNARRSPSVLPKRVWFTQPRTEALTRSNPISPAAYCRSRPQNLRR
jgi:hypothetical protein